jgi:hypothetical protein
MKKMLTPSSRGIIERSSRAYKNLFSIIFSSFLFSGNLLTVIVYLFIRTLKNRF